MFRISLILCLFVGTTASADSYIRVSKNDKGQTTSLDVSIDEFQKAEARVALIGVVHVADKSYYEELNQEFENYDAVLYELVLPGEEEPSFPRGESSLAEFQHGVSSFLDLAFQLDIIDYSKKNFVHADMSVVELKEAMEKDQTTFADLFISALLASYKKQLSDIKQSQVMSLKLALGFLSPNRSRIIKRAVAGDLADVGKQSNVLGKELNALLVERRNEAALKVLRKQLEKKPNGNFAIFYGAAHMPDFAIRLEKEFGFKQSNTRWLTAWDLGSS